MQFESLMHFELPARISFVLPNQVAAFLLSIFSGEPNYSKQALYLGKSRPFKMELNAFKIRIPPSHNLRV